MNRHLLAKDIYFHEPLLKQGLMIIYASGLAALPGSVTELRSLVENVNASACKA